MNSDDLKFQRNNWRKISNLFAAMTLNITNNWCCIYIYIYIYIYTHTHTHTYIHNTYIQKYIHTYIHTYMHTYIYDLELRNVYWFSFF